MNRFTHWLYAIRPRTLSISLIPVAAGTGLAWAETGSIAWFTGFAAMLGALLIQIGTNLLNDAADYERGADTPSRVGPPRATAQGWFSANEVKRGAYLSFGLAFLVGIYLAWIGGWPIVVIGLLSLTAGYAYTSGPRPIAYSGTGEFFVFLFFGVIAVNGAYYLQAGPPSANALLLGCALGSQASAVLLVNNYRDLETDEQAGKLTLVHYLGRQRAHQMYGALILLPFVLPLLLDDLEPGSWLPLAALPLALVLLRRFMRVPPGPRLNTLLTQTAQLQVAYGLLLILGFLV